jgi:hypothetical protein
MAATPQYAGFTLVGQSGKTYSLDAYVSDVNAGLVNVDGGAGASSSSPTYWIAPENVTLIDYQQVTGTADTEKIRVIINGRPTNNVLRYVPHLTTNATRPRLSIGIAAGAQLAFSQISD